MSNATNFAATFSFTTTAAFEAAKANWEAFCAAAREAGATLDVGWGMLETIATFADGSTVRWAQGE